MRVFSCLATEHTPWLVLLSILTCVSGSWVAFRLFGRAAERAGLQRAGWMFLAAIAAGSAVWCTHFIAMLAYNAAAPVSFDPVLTMLSFFVAIIGCAIGLSIALQRRALAAAPEIGGIVNGLAIAAMHYIGMMAYRIDGVIEWDTAYVIVSVVLSVVLSLLATSLFVRRPFGFAGEAAVAAFVMAIASLHFTGMAALVVMPMPGSAMGTDPDAMAAMAVAVAGVGFIIATTGIASYLIDARSSLESLRRLEHLAHNDALTGLPNRVSFADHLGEQLMHAQQARRKLAVVGIDLDRFKVINDLRGHAAGDQALRIISRRLSRLRREGEFIARVGGDEFAAVKRVTDHKDLLDFAARLENALFQPLKIDDFESTSGASIGIAVFPQDGDTEERLVGNADLAMYRAKADVTRALCFYEPHMDEGARARRALGQDLRRAVELEQFELHYQVQTSVPTGDVRGYEVLLRWNHPELGRVPPSDFIPIAEENGLILPIGEWVLRTACAEAASWPVPWKIAVNLSPVQFAHADLAALVASILRESGLRAERLELEITETTIIADKQRTLRTLRQIRDLGVNIALDDFGTGYSSLDTLRSFPFDKIKLDRSFMMQVEENAQAKAIVRAVLTLGKSLDIPVLAEGVETISQLTILRSEGCDEAQGFYLGRPKPVSQLFASEALG